jgi:prepilin-type N-terminal cleavage/methylation domain-containing protein/prepilin-type processing-associated H-X9-DG protein
MPNAMRTRRRATAGRGQGFTLVELLVTAAIIAILVGLLVPAVGALRRSSLELRCLSNLRQMAVSLHSYMNANAERFPISSHTTGSLDDPSAWINSMAAHGFDGDVRRCPADPSAELRPTSYATNTFFEPLVAGIDFDPFSGGPLPGGRTAAVTRLVQAPHPDRTFWAVEVPGEGLIDHLHSVGWTEPEEIEAAVAVRRHGASSNTLFADGHAGTVDWMRLKTDFKAGRNPFDPMSSF